MRRALVLTLLAGVAAGAFAAEPKAIYEATCATCHATGVASAPKLSDGAEWQRRLQRGGLAALVDSALKGRGAMPAKGGNAALADADVRATVQYMLRSAGVTASAAVVPAPAPAKAAAKSDPVNRTYAVACAICHREGALNAPRLDDAAAWAPRLAAGTAALYANALGGKGGMPPRGGNPNLTDAEVKGAVDYMVAQVKAMAAKAAAPKPAAAVAAKAPAVPGAAASSVPASSPEPANAAAPTASPAPKAAAPAAAPPPAEPIVTAASDVNAFNRLLRAPSKRNLPPPQDGIHDPTNDGTLQLQAPLEAFAALPKSNAGNQIDWVRALAENRIAPRADRVDPKAEMALLDLNIVREVKGSMPDVVYPHKSHTQWLDCSNCHPSIFVPQKGANQISMASILLGQKCGVCHGKVAFPVSECRRCHSKPKTTATAAGGKP
jgi:c(7)-type cytochrome triheme protein